MSRRVTSLSLKEKLELLQNIRNNVDKQELCVKYKINRSTLHRIVRSEEKIRNIAVAGKNLDRKRNRGGLHRKVEKALGLWLKDIQQENATITNAIILDKAREFAIKYKEDFNPGSSWLYRWTKRENIKIGKSYLKSKNLSNTDEILKPNDSTYAQSFIPHVIKDYDPECIFNASECALLYKAVPSFHGGNLENENEDIMPKARFSVLFVCNATGNFRKLYVIGKQSIEAQKNTNMPALPVPYFVNKKAYLSNALWNAILGELDAEMLELNRKIILFVNKTSCHQLTSEFHNINVQFMQAKSSIFIQPLDLGIIKAFKIQYLERMVKKQICALERGQNRRQFLKSFSVLNALFLIKQTWSMIKPETIAKSFEKSGLLSHAWHDQTEIDKNSILKLVPKKSNYLHVDYNIKCTETVKSKVKLEPQEAFDENSLDSNEGPKDPLNCPDESEDSNNELSDDDDEDEDSDCHDEIQRKNAGILIPSAKAALVALETLQNFCLFNNINSDSIEYVENSICQELIRQSKK